MLQSLTKTRLYTTVLLEDVTFGLTKSSLRPPLFPLHHRAPFSTYKPDGATSIVVPPQYSSHKFIPRKSDCLSKTSNSSYLSSKSYTLRSRLFHSTRISKNDGEPQSRGTSRTPSSNTTSSSIPPEKPITTKFRIDSPSQQSSQHARNFINRLPSLPQLHRPSREELLAAATGFWSRLKVRFKWASIRSTRPFNNDEIGGFFTVIAFGHLVWLVLGTTTFFSLAIFAINTVFAQEALAGWVGNYLTKSTGLTVVFESAVVPRWGSGVITFKSVFVSRRPGQAVGTMRKGSPATAAAVAAAAAESARENEDSSTLDAAEDTNYTQFDVQIDEINVTLSFRKWFNSKGLLQDVSISGVRGVIDRRSVHWNGIPQDPKSYRHEHQLGDFELDSFKLENVLLTVYQPAGFRPFSVSVYACDLPRLRKQWLFYDFMAANTMSGSFDDSLFTIHPRQMHGFSNSSWNSDSEQDYPWYKQNRLRIDGLKIDHLNRGVEGPFGWIHEGNVDIVADVMFPQDSDESITKVMSDLYDKLEATLTSRLRLPAKESEKPRYVSIFDDASLSTSPPDENSTGTATSSTSQENNEDRRFLIMDLKIHLNDVRASVPLFTHDLSYINNALIRPIVAYMNSRHTFIPISCRVVKRATDFDGSWTLYDSGLLDDLSAETYTAIAKDVDDDQMRIRRFKKVGLWSLQLAIQALFMGMAGNLA